MNLKKLGKLQSKSILSKYWIVWCGIILWFGYRIFTEDSTEDPPPHWGEIISLIILAVMVSVIVIMITIKFWPSNWENDPDNPTVQIREGMKIFDGEKT